MKKNKKIFLATFLGISILATAGSTLAYGGGQGQGKGRGAQIGGGCMGDTVCMEERQAQMGMKNNGMETGHGRENNKKHDRSELEAIKNSDLLEISEKDIETLERMREEEKLAGDVYKTLYQK
jgi:hypothetical protein